MEDNIQTIIVVIISAFLLFIFPVYMAYEKKDDISYALAMRYTQDLVDEVRSKGYITKYMYDDYNAKLKVTGNSYAIDMTHTYNRYDPITNYYKEEKVGENKLKLVLAKTTTQELRHEAEKNYIQEGINLGKLDENSTDEKKAEYLKEKYEELGFVEVRDTYLVSKQIYTTDHILSILKSEDKLLLNSTMDTVKCGDIKDENGNSTGEKECQYAYTMNVDDNFNVTIKNTNITLATVIYNMVTANTLDSNTRIYVNYGGAILNTRWYGNIDYAKLKHDNLGLNKQYKATNVFSGEREYKVEPFPTEEIAQEYEGQYILDFDVKPEEVTELREKGNITVANFSGYNFAFGRKKTDNNIDNLAISVGLNGISLITNTYVKYSVPNTFVTLPTDNVRVEKQVIELENYTYTDEETGEEKTGQREVQKTVYEYIPTERKISDYSSVKVGYSNGKLHVVAEPKHIGVSRVDKYISVTGDKELLGGLNETVQPTVGTKTIVLGNPNNARGTKRECYINITENTIGVSAQKSDSVEGTILSYPTTIDNYINVRVEFEEIENTLPTQYTAVLYIDDVKVAESVRLARIPKVDLVGGATIGDETRYFIGNIRNPIIYILENK